MFCVLGVFILTVILHIY